MEEDIDIIEDRIGSFNDSKINCSIKFTIRNHETYRSLKIFLSKIYRIISQTNLHIILSIIYIYITSKLIDKKSMIYITFIYVLICCCNVINNKYIKRFKVKECFLLLMLLIPDIIIYCTLIFLVIPNNPIIYNEVLIMYEFFFTFCSAGAFIFIELTKARRPKILILTLSLCFYFFTLYLFLSFKIALFFCLYMINLAFNSEFNIFLNELNSIGELIYYIKQILYFLLFFLVNSYLILIKISKISIT